MSFGYSPDPANTLDKVRFLIGDTDTENTDKQIFQDDELEMIITEAGSDIFLAAGMAMMAIASSSARIATVCTIGNRDFSIDRTAVAKECRENARVFFERSENTLYATEAALEDEDITQIDTMGQNEWNYETAIDELND